MRRIIPLILIIVSAGAYAQQGMSEVDMQRMMQQAKKMEACMADIDQAALTSLAEKSRAMEQEVKSLCQANKRSEAQKHAIEFGQEIAANDEMKKMRQCGEMMQGMMPAIGLPTVEEMKNRHICDDY
jgi:arginine/lysine/ornithine decarboxylase